MVPLFTGRIVEWDRERGCGWLESDGQRIFLHWREFAERRKRPEVGDEVRFTAGTGPTGEICAKNAVHVKSGGRFGIFGILLLLALLVCPTFAVVRLRIDPLVATCYTVLVNGITYLAYASDKERARQGRRQPAGQRPRRTPEVRLHFLELIGGWPSAFVAQRRLRHKCVKLRYQMEFWIIVAIHQYVAFGFLQGWELPKAILRGIRSVIRLANPAFW